MHYSAPISFTTGGASFRDAWDGTDLVQKFWNAFRGIIIIVILVGLIIAAAVVLNAVGTYLIGSVAMAVLDAGRIGIASQALGIAEAAYEASLDYAREREAFGKKIGQFQGISFTLADMKTRIEASRLLIYQAALAKEQSKKTGERFTLEASMAKLYASETAMFCSHAAVQIHGGMGYSKELPIERYFRDAKITEIYEGTSEIQRLVISRLELGLR